YFESKLNLLPTILSRKNAILLTDEHLFSAHPKQFKGWSTIVLKAGEEQKVQATVDSVIQQLINKGADRTTTLVGVGGGVVTDLTGYIASIYMRGIPFGFLPTSLLAMVDASIGGKNGIDVGVYKNMVGCIRQPQFILYDACFLSTLPEKEWINGFAEIIKHAAIKDAPLFRQLEANSLPSYQKKKSLLSALVQRNAILKTKVVQLDEFEQADRKLLNFGHTLGHALEKQHDLAHGSAVAIGMVAAAKLSGFFSSFKDTDRLTQLLDRYGLPVQLAYNKDQVFTVLKSDKKKEDDFINYVLLRKIGQGFIQKISLEQLYNYL
ncbi:MAG: 3-dehydroquinate synthase, partial [Chitinophagaceae bacterium]